MFRTVSEISGDTVERIPDGETGERLGWIEALVPKLRATPELVEGARSHGYKSQPSFWLKEGACPDEFDISELGYSAAAADSYRIFADLRDEGVIPAGTRFQVSLPTVTAAVEVFIAEPDRECIERGYVRRLAREVDQILRAVPKRDLAIQWDVAVEMGIVEGVFPTRFQDPLGDVIERLATASGWIPSDVPLGFHLCYGDAQEVTGEGEGRHWMEPRDTACMVEVANAISRSGPRSVQWFSMPVPIDRDDDAYFEPLEGLELDPETTLYLGLVHHQDGIDGTQRRIETAKRHIGAFGVATECGIGRKPAALVPKLLQIQREVTV